MHDFLAQDVRATLRCCATSHSELLAGVMAMRVLSHMLLYKHVQGPLKAAIYRDDNGDLHQMAATCTHLGCVVRFCLIHDLLRSCVSVCLAHQLLGCQ